MNGMPIEKVENQLNLALDLPEEIREKTLDLGLGFDEETKTWELIVKYSGSLSKIEEELGISVVPLLNEYAIITIAESLIPKLSSYVEIEFIEKPKGLSFEVNEGRRVSCINPLQTPTYNLFGQGIIIAVIDSGIDYSHLDFRNEDGTTRILDLWDQTIDGNPPAGYNQGTLYTRDKINEALELPLNQRMQLVPSRDLSGHGTHVAGIAGGNGAASAGVYRGVASQCEFIIVKLGPSQGSSFPRTTQLMQGIDYSIKRAAELGMPLAINLSFGNNYGSHSGRSLLEEYINGAANIWKNSIVIGTGNEGAAGRHAQGTVTMGQNEVVQLAISEFETTINIQIWKNYYDKFDIILISPGGQKIGPIPEILGTQQFSLEQTQIYLYYGEPTPYNLLQEIYIEMIPLNNYINSGIWTIELVPSKIVTGEYNMWLPTGGIMGAGTRFLISEEFTTLTIPSTAFRAISVGAYNGYTDGFAPFSGRGYTRTGEIKPDIVAPGVDIVSSAPNGGYTMKSGTSMATPFVTGSAALLMQWGIVEGRDPYLYGEKVKAYLISGARPLRVEKTYPNRRLGFGALCLRNSLR